MKSKKVRMCIALAVAAAFVLTGCAQAKTGSGTLKVGVRDDIMDFGYYNERAEKYYGLEIDLAEDLAARLGYANVEYVTVTPDNRKDTLLEGKVDCVIAAYSVAASRLENFDFSEPYYTDETNVMVEDSSLIHDMDQLAGKNIGVLAGSNAAPIVVNFLKEKGIITGDAISQTDEQYKYDNATITRYDTYDDLYWALERGHVDAVCMDGCIAHQYLDDTTHLLDGSLEDQNYAVATNKGSELSEPVDNAIKEMLEDGTIAELVDKWL